MQPIGDERHSGWLVTVVLVSVVGLLVLAGLAAVALIAWEIVT